MNSNIKKWAVSLSAIALLCGISVLPIVNFDLQASAWEDYELVTSGTDGNFSFSIQDGKATLTDYTGSDAIVTIPEAVGTTTKTTPPKTVSVPVTALEQTFYNNSNITSVTIPDGVTTIGYNTFTYCDNLKTVSHGKQLQSIGESAFSSCSALESFSFQEGLLTIANDAFSNCTSLKSVTLPNSLTTLGESAFQDDSALESVQFGNGITEVSAHAFESCSSLTSITFSESIQRIRENAFADCSALKKLTLPNSLTQIDSKAFCAIHSETSLRSISFGSGLQEIGPYAFAFHTKLAGILTLPEQLTTIGDYAFSGCSSVTQLQFPNGLQSIQKGAFQNCSELRAISLPNTVTTLGESAFENCNNVKNLSLSGSLTELPNLAFYGCGISDLCIPDSVTQIGVETFSNCSSLSAVQLSRNLKTISHSAFYNCEELKSISFPTGLETIGEAAFAQTALGSISLPDTLTELGQAAFYNIPQLKFAKIPGSLKTIPRSAFYNCYGLNAVELQEGIEIIEESAFANASLRSLILPDSIIEIGDAAFQGVDYLSTIQLGSNLQLIGSKAFLLQSDTLCSLYVPESVISIGEKAIGYWAEFEWDTPTVGSHFILYGESGSEAQDYAKSNSISFLTKSEPGLTKYYDAATGITVFAPDSGLQMQISVSDSQKLEPDPGYTFQGWYQIQFTKNGSNYTPAFLQVQIPMEQNVRRCTVFINRLNGFYTEIYYPQNGSIDFTTTKDAFQLDVCKQLLGDVNDDGTVTLADLIMLQKYMLYNGTLLAPENADLNQDTACNGFDLLYLKRTLFPSIG